MPLPSFGSCKVGMKKWAPINYRDFWDRPRIFLVQSESRLILFDAPFSEENDEYADTYKIYLMPPLGEAELNGSWVDLLTKADRFVGEVSVKDVEFDPTLRRQINLEILVQFGI
jgi:hypothetical protein